MGQKISTLKVSASVTVFGGTGVVDGIRLSYQSRSCCGRRREIASFTFPRSGWSRGDVVRNTSSNVATVAVGKLGGKDGDTPVKVACMVAGIPVFKTRIALADLLHGLELTKGVLFFSLVGRVAEGGEPKAQAFVALFCNGQRCGGAVANYTKDSSGHGNNGHQNEVSPGLKQDKPVETSGQSTEENTNSEPREDEVNNTEPSPVGNIEEMEIDEIEIEQLTREIEHMEKEIKQLEIEAMEIEQREHHVLRKRKRNNRSKKKEDSTKEYRKDRAMDRKDHSHSGDFVHHEPGWVWDVLADCCMAAALLLSLYNVWQQYREY